MIELPGTLLGSRGKWLNDSLEVILIIMILFISSLYMHSVVLWEVIGRTFDAKKWVRKSIHPTRILTFKRYVGVSQKTENKPSKQRQRHVQTQKGKKTMSLPEIRLFQCVYDIAGDKAGMVKGWAMNKFVCYSQEFVS